MLCACTDRLAHPLCFGTHRILGMTTDGCGPVSFVQRL